MIPLMPYNLIISQVKTAVCTALVHLRILLKTSCFSALAFTEFVYF